MALEPENPSVRCCTLTQLPGTLQDETEVQQVRAAILTSKPVQRIYAKMHPDGYWLHRGVGAAVSYAMSSSTHFVLSCLAELGLDRTDKELTTVADLLAYYPRTYADRTHPVDVM